MIDLIFQNYFVQVATSFSLYLRLFVVRVGGLFFCGPTAGQLREASVRVTSGINQRVSL